MTLIEANEYEAAQQRCRYLEEQPEVQLLLLVVRLGKGRETVPAAVLENE
jgi:hypothetical protein